MDEIAAIQARLRETSSVPDLLALSFSAFESIRVLARGGEATVPGLFAAFMMTADAAVDGREAITIAPSLSLAGVSTRSADLSASDRGIGRSPMHWQRWAHCSTSAWPMPQAARPRQVTGPRAEQPPGPPGGSTS
jgi:hypothetical protein